MKLNQSKLFLVILLVLLATPALVMGQRTKPRLRRAAPKVVAPLVPVGTNLKVRLNDTLSSKESRAGDKFTAYVLDPVRFNEATVRGHVRSIVKSGRWVTSPTQPELITHELLTESIPAWTAPALESRCWTPE